MMYRPMTRSRHWLLSIVLLAGLTGNAQAQDEDAAQPDARLQGYQISTGEQGQTGAIMLPAKDARGAAGTWFTLIGLSLIGVGAMFKSGKRTHLD